MDVLRWPEERVRIYNPHRKPAPDVQADQYLCVWLGGEWAVDDINNPGGRVDTRAYIKLHTWLRTRCALDEVGSDELWLTDPELGHYVWRWAVKDALQIFLPEDAGRNALSVCPIHWRSDTDYERDRDAMEWGTSESLFVVEMEYNILTSYSPLG